MLEQLAVVVVLVIAYIVWHSIGGIAGFIIGCLIAILFCPLAVLLRGDSKSTAHKQTGDTSAAGDKKEPDCGE